MSNRPHLSKAATRPFQTGILKKQRSVFLFPSNKDSSTLKRFSQNLSAYAVWELSSAQVLLGSWLVHGGKKKQWISSHVPT